MEAGAGGRALMVMMMVVVVATMTGSQFNGVGVQAQQGCVSKLVSCGAAISNTSVKPTKECCSGLAEAVKNELKCLCDVYSNPIIFQNMNKTRALEIPGLCGVSSDLSRCNSTAATPPPSSLASPPPTSGSYNKQGIGALRLTWSLKPLWALGLFWVALNMY